MGSEVVVCQWRQERTIALLAMMLPHGWMDERYKKDGWERSATTAKLASLSVNTTGWNTVAWWTWFDVVALPKLHTHTCEEKFSLAVMDLACLHPLAFIITLLPSTIRWMNLATYTQLFNPPSLCSLHNIALLSMSWDSEFCPNPLHFLCGRGGEGSFL